MGREQISLPKDKMVRKLKIRTEPVLREVVDVVPSDNSGLSGWAVALIIIFVVLVVLTIVIVAYSCTRKNRCFGKGDVLVSGSANSQSAPSAILFPTPMVIVTGPEKRELLTMPLTDRCRCLRATDKSILARCPRNPFWHPA